MTYSTSYLIISNHIFQVYVFIETIVIRKEAGPPMWINGLACTFAAVTAWRHVCRHKKTAGFLRGSVAKSPDGYKLLDVKRYVSSGSGNICRDCHVLPPAKGDLKEQYSN